MSKERLEEIKEDVFKCNHGSTRGYSYEQLYSIALSLVRIHGEWLIEQAERVERLEKKLSINTNNMKQLQKQNQYYKQALEEIRCLYPLRNVGYQVSEIRKIVIKALEGKK